VHQKAFELLRAALMAIIPREDGILISTMFYADEIKEFQKQYAKPQISE
jgi:DNA end-binding protein Ku